MSIRDLIVHQTTDPLRPLAWYEPQIQNEMKRYLLLAREVQQVLVGPWQNAREERRCGQLRADFDKFVFGQRLSVAMDPYLKEKSAFLALVDPIAFQVWDMRSIDPSPAIRVLGCFTEQDVFVALVWEYREKLDGPGGRLWQAFINRARQEWRRLFLAFIPHAGVQISDYVSTNFRAA